MPSFQVELHDVGEVKADNFFDAVLAFREAMAKGLSDGMRFTVTDEEGNTKVVRHRPGGRMEAESQILDQERRELHGNMVYLCQNSEEFLRLVCSRVVIDTSDKDEVEEWIASLGLVPRAANNS